MLWELRFIDVGMNGSIPILSIKKFYLKKNQITTTT